MINKLPKDLSECRDFFVVPRSVTHRKYEALRAYFVEGRPSAEVARDFGYTKGSFQVLCHHFRRDPDPQFFLSPRHGPTKQPKKSAARETIIKLRKQNHSVYEISEALREQGMYLSPTAVREVLKEEGFAALPRRQDEERHRAPHPTIEAVANVADFHMQPRDFTTRCGGLFLFVPDLIALDLDKMAREARLPGSGMIPTAHALRACLAMKLFGIERKSHAMALVADDGLALFPGLNVFPKKSYLSEYSPRITPKQTTTLLQLWNDRLQGPKGKPLPIGQSLNLDFHSVPFYGEDPMIENHYVSARSRSQPSVLVFLAQDPEAGVFCYSNADLRKGEEADEIFRFLSFWKKVHGSHPQEVVFDSRLTTYANLAKLDRRGISFITLRRRSPNLLKEIANLPASAWRVAHLDVPTRKYRTPRLFEQTVVLEGCKLRQLFIKDLGHDEPTILLANSKRTTTQLILRYAQRMLIENALSDAVRFFHMDALSSVVGMKVDFDMALLVIASGLYRLLAQRMRGYSNPQARQIFRDLVDMPATVSIKDKEVEVSFHKRAHLPIILASGLLNQPVKVPWWNGMPLRLIDGTPRTARA